MAGAEYELIDLAAGTDYETPLTTVLVNTAAATRTIVNPPAAELEIAPLAGEWRASWGERPRVAMTDGFYLEETLPLLAATRDAGCEICFDGGSWKPGTDRLAPMLMAAICSERFALPGKAADAEATLAWFTGQGVPCAAVTRGARPILAVDRGRRFEIEVEPVAAVDTLGAGDVLHGAFCFEYARAGDFEAALRFAAGIATRSCGGVGIACWAAD